MSLWDQVRANMSEWYAVAADKTEEMARIGVRKYDKFTISRDIERAFTDLGSHVYAAAQEGRAEFANDPVVNGAVERIRALEQQLQAKEQEIQTIRAAAKPWPSTAPPGAAPAGPGAARRTAGPAAGAPGATTPAPSSGAPAPIEPDDADIEASLDPRASLASPRGPEPWDDEIALWNEPLDLDEEPGDDAGKPRAPQSRTD